MMLTLAWKDYREQRAIWVAMAVLSAGLMAATQLLTPSDLSALQSDRVWGVIAVFALAQIYGLVCGATLLAGEVEAGTLAFLDTLPATRMRLWQSKALTGAALSLTQGVLVGIVVALVGVQLGEEPIPPSHWVWMLPAAVLEAFAWGLFGSALTRTPMWAIAVAVWPLWLSCTAGVAFAWPPHPVGLLLRAGMTTLALCLSALVFCQTDRDRRTARAQWARSTAPTQAPGTPAWLVLLWLSARQGRGLAVLLLVGVLVTLPVLMKVGLLAWLLATLVLGVLCGTAVFADEQARGAYRFLGEQRLPLVKWWGIKSGLWLVVGLALTALLLLALVVTFVPLGTQPFARQTEQAREQFTLISVVLLGGMNSDVSAVSVRWLIAQLYGFALGQLFAVVWRKSVVAFVLAGLCGTLVAGAWVPSLVGGGLPAWQVLLGPALLLAAVALVLRAWTADRLQTPPPVAVLLGSGVLTVLAITACLAWRVYGVPDVGEPFDVQAFVASIPGPEKNEAARLLRQVARELGDLRQQMEQEAAPAGGEGGMPGAAAGPGMGMPGVPGEPPAPPMARVDEPALPAPALGAGPDTPDPWGQAGEVLQRGWRAASPALGKLLDKLFQAEWAKTLREAVALPPGVLIDPRHATINTQANLPDELRTAAVLFCARALQLQAAGKDREALDHLLVVLALARQLQAHALLVTYVTGTAIEDLALTGIERWLEKLGPRPELLRAALDHLGRYEAEQPPVAELVKAQYLVFRNTLASPHVLAHDLGLDMHGTGQPSAALILTSLEAPWEKMRTERILNALFAGWLRAAELPSHEQVALLNEPVQSGKSVGWAIVRDWLPPAGRSTISAARLAALVDGTWMQRFLVPPVQMLRDVPARALCLLRGRRLELALALYQLQEGRPAPNLGALVPRYLPEVPNDPFTGQPFHYRISEGEQILWADWLEHREVAPGQGLAWSVGPDQKDDNAQRQGFTMRPGEKGDMIFVVPKP